MGSIPTAGIFLFDFIPVETRFWCPGSECNDAAIPLAFFCSWSKGCRHSPFHAACFASHVCHQCDFLHPSLGSIPFLFPQAQGGARISQLKVLGDGSFAFLTLGFVEEERYGKKFKNGKRVFSRKEVAEHSTVNDGWVIIADKVPLFVYSL